MWGGIVCWVGVLWCGKVVGGGVFGWWGLVGKGVRMYLGF